MLLILLAGSAQVKSQDKAPGDIRLLPGYHVKWSAGLDVVSATIEKKEGLIIHYVGGISEGRIVKKEDKSRYKWYREQIIDGRRFLLALTSADRKGGLDAGRKNSHGADLLLITYPWAADGAKAFVGESSASNFTVAVAGPEEMMDALLMVLTFDPTKGRF